MILEVVDAVLAIIPVPTGVLKDDSATAPVNLQPKRLYAFPIPRTRQRLQERDGRFDEADLLLRLLLTAAAKGEPRVQRTDRAITEWLVAGAEPIIAALNDPTNTLGNPLWWDLYIEGEPVPDAVRTESVRAYAIDLVVRLNEGVLVGSGS